MIKVREEVEHNIWWQAKAGNLSFWFDNWTKLGALYYIEDINNSEEEVDVREFIVDGQWNKLKLASYLSDMEIVQYICEEIRPSAEGGMDKAWWMANSNGKFSVRSAWDILRTRKKQVEVEKQLWVRGLSFKINFSSESLEGSLHEETMQHLFLTAPIAQQIWKFFARWLGIRMNETCLQVVIKTWWAEGANHKMTNIQAEAVAILEAVRYWAKDTHIAKVLEARLRVMVKSLKRRCKLQ
ncbi:hypothetical protein H5410_012810 [Solanum commersonii]|uniref:RNase H family protein n=1 Tax=Solanum commersonii TaxID=4109 RepID=A0A9J6ASP3_SOLCO|nr:hypothetical protein H5410_012810 [Solanum commersonii]